MAALNLLNGYGQSGSNASLSVSPLEGWLNMDQGRYIAFGRGTFTTTGTTATIPPRGASTKVDAVFLTAGTAGVVGLSYSIGTDGTVTITRTDTTSGGEVSFLIVYRG